MAAMHRVEMHNGRTRPSAVLRQILSELRIFELRETQQTNECRDDIGRNCVASQFCQKTTKSGTLSATAAVTDDQTVVIKPRKREKVNCQQAVQVGIALHRIALPTRQPNWESLQIASAIYKESLLKILLKPLKACGAVSVFCRTKDWLHLRLPRSILLPQTNAQAVDRTLAEETLTRLQSRFCRESFNLKSLQRAQTLLAHYITRSPFGTHTRPFNSRALGTIAACQQSGERISLSKFFFST